MKKVLFVCVHNSARSQMAQAFCNAMAQGKLSAESAGLEPGRLNPLAVQVMAEVGLDIAHHKTKSVQGLIKCGGHFDYIVTVCDEASAERCSVFPGSGKRLHFAFEDPSSLTGSEEKKLSGTRRIRDEIRDKIDAWIRGLEKK